MEILRTDIIDIVGKSQDGGALRPDEDIYCNAIVEIINYAPSTGELEDEDCMMDPTHVIANFNYMIKELKKAVVALELHIKIEQDKKS